MVALRDLARRGAILVLARLGREESLTMRDFTRSSGLVPDRSKVLREALVGLGLVESRVVARRGAQARYEIRLTPLGREVARHLVAVEDVLSRNARPASGQNGTSPAK